VFGDRLLCNVLRPQLLAEAEYAWIRAEVALVLRALRRVAAAYDETPALRDELALTPLEQAALAIDPRYSDPVPFARMDAFFDRASGTLQFVEFNGETPAGVGYSDVLAEVFATLLPVRRLVADHGARFVAGRQQVLDTLLALAARAGVAGPHAIAIVDWEDVPTRAEFDIFTRFFTAAGVDARFATPADLRFDRGRLYDRDRPITIVYKRVLVTELLERCGLEHPLVAALRAGAAVMANPFQCRPLHKKASFAVLTDERFAAWFPPEEQAAIRAHVPWTRRVADRATLWRGERVDLLEWAAANREQLVLKPNDDYGGHGVVLGWEVDDAAWSQALQAGLAQPSVLQERVATAFEPFPVWTGQALAIEPRLVDLDPYCYHGRDVHGVLTRLSAGSLLNVTAGGGSVTPTFVVAD
jgi:uncharacterized circularly permuted ATP-grasp superfamily protein